MGRGPVKFTVRLYPGQDDDLIRWLAQYDMPGTPHGAKTRAIKTAWRRGLKDDVSEGSDLATVREVVREALDAASPTLDRAQVQEVVRVAMEETMGRAVAMPFTLTDIRQVVEVAIQEKLDDLRAAEHSQEEQCRKGGRQDEAALEVDLERLDASLLRGR